MSSAYKLTIPEDFPLSDEDPMESDLELTPTPRKPPTEWGLCWDLLEMVGKEVLAVRKRNTIQYWQDITGQKNVNVLEKYGTTLHSTKDSREVEGIINRRMTLRTIKNHHPEYRQHTGISEMCKIINNHTAPYKTKVIRTYPKSRAKKNRCSVCRRVGHNKRNCPHAQQQLRQMRYDKLTNPSARTPSLDYVGRIVNQS